MTEEVFDQDAILPHENLRRPLWQEALYFLLGGVAVVVFALWSVLVVY